MYSTIIRMAWPYVGRYAAERAAAYLQARKERLEHVAEEQVERLEAKVEDLPAPAELRATSTGSSTWLVLASLLLMAVVGFVLYRLVMPPDESNQRL